MITERKKRGAVLVRLEGATAFPSHQTRALMTPQDERILRYSITQAQTALRYPSFPPNVGRPEKFRVAVKADTPIDPRLWRWMNYARWRVILEVQRTRGQPISRAAATEIIHWQALALSVRDFIFGKNVALCHSMVRMVRERSQVSATIRNEELIAEAQLGLVKAIDYFDCERGFKFSSYACRAIIRMIYRHINAEGERRECAELLPTDRPSHELIISDDIRAIREAMENGVLTQREKRVLRMRYFEGAAVPTVAHAMKWPMAEVRFIEKTALEKLRAKIS